MVRGRNDDAVAVRDAERLVQGIGVTCGEELLGDRSGVGAGAGNIARQDLKVPVPLGQQGIQPLRHGTGCLGDPFPGALDQLSLQRPDDERGGADQEERHQPEDSQGPSPVRQGSQSPSLGPLPAGRECDRPCSVECTHSLIHLSTQPALQVQESPWEGNPQCEFRGRGLKLRRLNCLREPRILSSSTSYAKRRLLSMPVSDTASHGGPIAAVFRFLAWCNLAGGAMLVLMVMTGGHLLLPASSRYLAAGTASLIEVVIWLLVTAASWAGPMAVAQVLEDLEAIRLALGRADHVEETEATVRRPSWWLRMTRPE